VLPGVTIADDVVVGAGAVVTRDCLEPGVYLGIPATRRS
jgi:acetyltransferase-like isoleucine patch superfamily enzyme